jgi:hypothetical protein
MNRDSRNLNVKPPEADKSAGFLVRRTQKAEGKKEEST